ncbi:MAG: hypothetical protein H5T78_08505 [Nocardia sp.]|nr:hypothetical protein [Nocardia sp.]
MNTLTRTLTITLPLLCVVGVAAAPAAAHSDIDAPPAAADTAPVPHHGAPAPICGGGVAVAHPPVRARPLRSSQRAAVPGTVPSPPALPKPQDAPTSTIEPAAATGLAAAVFVELLPGPAPAGERMSGSPVGPPERPSGAGRAASCGRDPSVVPVTVPRRELVPVPVPVQVTIHDLDSAPPGPRSTDRSAGTRSEVEIVVRANGASGSAAQLPAVLREMVQTLTAQQRVPTPRPHR